MSLCTQLLGYNFITGKLREASYIAHFLEPVISENFSLGIFFSKTTYWKSWFSSPPPLMSLCIPLLFFLNLVPSLETWAKYYLVLVIIFQYFTHLVFSFPKVFWNVVITWKMYDFLQWKLINNCLYFLMNSFMAELLLGVVLDLLVLLIRWLNYAIFYHLWFDAELDHSLTTEVQTIFCCFWLLLFNLWFHEQLSATGILVIKSYYDGNWLQMMPWIQF